jgi:hypothetical protein
MSKSQMKDNSHFFHYEINFKIPRVDLPQDIVAKTTPNKMLPSALAGGSFYIAMCKFMVYNLYIG